VGDQAWLVSIAPASGPITRSFGGVDVWSSITTFERWPNVEPSSHEFNCRKGRGLVTGASGDMSCAEVEIARRFRRAGWNAGWLATCGRRNDAWREVMFMVRTPASSVLPVPVPLLPARIAGILARHGTSGYPDIVAWQSERHPVFVELKGPDDKGTAQAAWVASAVAEGSILLEDFLLLSWNFD
jgi:hypothetical protein